MSPSSILMCPTVATARQGTEQTGREQGLPVSTLELGVPTVDSRVRMESLCVNCLNYSHSKRCGSGAKERALG